MDALCGLIYIALAKPHDDNDDDDGRYMPLPGGSRSTEEKKDQETLPIKKTSFMTSEHHIEQLSQNASVMPLIYHPEKKKEINLAAVGPVPRADGLC